MGFFPGAGAQQKVSAHLKTEGYDGPIGIKIRGNSSKAFNQKKYTIETRDENGKDLDVSLLGMPAHSKWVLLAPYNDVSMVRDPLAFQLWRDMGHWAPRTVMCEVTVDGQYRGIYILCEAIKRGKDRVDIAKMKKSDTEGREVTGGYLLRIDTADENDFTFTSKLPGIGEGIMSSDVIWSCIYPKKEKLQPAQSAYIVSYVDTVEQVIQSDAFADPAKGYAHYIDVASFVDYFIHTELSLNADAYRRSAYFYKEKQKADGTGGKLFAGPVWDYNYAYGNSNLANADKPDSWCYEGSNNNPTPAMWQRLLQDPKFRKAVKQRYQKLRKSVLSNKTINAYIDRQVKLLSQAQAHHFATYPELLVNEAQKQQFEERKQKDPMSGFGGFPFGGGVIPEGMPQGGMPSMVDLFAAYRVSSYDEEISVLKAWLANRLAFLDRNIARFDRDWEPRIQPLIEKKMQFPGFPSGGF
jgi:spore coat protein CotH